MPCDAITAAQAPTPGVTAALPRRWDAQLQLGFVWQDRGTRLQHRAHKGPLRVQKPFYPEGRQVCHVYVLHPPGGLVGGDHLDIGIDVACGAQALLTTPAAGKVYRSLDAAACQMVGAHVHEGGQLEWLPQETIVYEGARARLCTRVDLHGDARLAAWEITCLGRPAAGEGFTYGSCRSQLDVYLNGMPLLIERSSFAGASPRLSAAWGLGGRAASGTFVVHPATITALEAARAHCHGLSAQAIASSTLIDQTLVCRAIDADATLVRERFIATWTAVRPLVAGRVAALPRIWAT